MIRRSVLLDFGARLVLYAAFIAFYLWIFIAVPGGAVFIFSMFFLYWWRSK